MPIFGLKAHLELLNLYKIGKILRNTLIVMLLKF
jgi:hypothetical protein